VRGTPICHAAKMTSNKCKFAGVDALVSGAGCVYLAEELSHGGPGVLHDNLEDGAGRTGHGQEPAERLQRIGMPSSWNRPVWGRSYSERGAGAGR
jgi:hypothetical protein